MKVLHIIGARPHFMKLAPVYEALKGSGGFRQQIVHSGQHYDHGLSGQFLAEFGLPNPDVNLGVGSKGHLPQIGEILIGLDRWLAEHPADMVIVYGDTNTTAAGAIAAAKLHIPLAHIEAGLREWDKSIPEEVNKRLIDAVTDLHFCPGETAVRNLAQIGITEGVHNVGDVVIPFIRKHEQKVEKAATILDQVRATKGQYYLATCHRARTTGQKALLAEVLGAFGALPKKVVFILHPRTREAISKFELAPLLDAPNITVLEPLPFWQTQALIKNAAMVLTDSGGMIKEAHLHKTPAVILDTQTEWVEIVEQGWAIVAGPSHEAIMKGTQDFTIPGEYHPLYEIKNAQQLIVHTIEKYLGSHG